MDDKPKNFYANAVNLLTSIFDITMVFRSQSPQIDDTGKALLLNGQPILSITDEITIRMSPQHAKALASLLVQQTIEYEKQFGIKLPLPPDLENIWKQNLKGS